MVFISYSHDSEDHKKLIFDLSREIGRDGIDVFIDQDRKDHEEDWPIWCEKKIIYSDYVIVVCTANYHDRVYDEACAPSGVKFEGFCIRQTLYKRGMLNHKIIPVIMSGADESFIPLFLHGYDFYNLENMESRRKLIARISSAPAERPPLGIVDRCKNDLETLNGMRHLMPATVFEECTRIISIDMLDKLGYRAR